MRERDTERQGEKEREREREREEQRGRDRQRERERERDKNVFKNYDHGTPYHPSHPRTADDKRFLRFFA